MIIPPTRKTDKWGSGKYKALRGNRLHQGIDYACLPSSILCSDVDGILQPDGIAYSDDHTYKIVNIRVNIQTRVRYFYVDPYPTLFVGEKIKRHQKIGVVQDIGKKYTGITPHYHFQVEIEGVPVDPERWLKEYINRY